MEKKGQKEIDEIFDDGYTNNGYEESVDSEIDTSSEKELDIEEKKQIIAHKRIDSMGDTPISMFERLAHLVDNLGFVKIILVIFLALFTYFSWQFVSAINYGKMADEILTAEEIRHEQSDYIRTINNQKISKSMIKMLYTMNADRVSVLEMHNGKENPTGLPFKYCDMTYEETMDSVHYVSEEYEDINMSRFKFPDYLYKHRYFVGSIKELYDIDKKLAMKLESNDVQYFGIIILKNSQEIGFLMVSYNDIPSNIENHDIHILLSDYAQEIGYYLDLTEHI